MWAYHVKLPAKQLTHDHCRITGRQPSELNFDAEYSFEHGALQLTLFARATNLLDAERRSHTSFLKDVAPLPGRNFSIGLRASY